MKRIKLVIDKRVNGNTPSIFPRSRLIGYLTCFPMLPHATALRQSRKAGATNSTFAANPVVAPGRMRCAVYIGLLRLGHSELVPLYEN